MFSVTLEFSSGSKALKEMEYKCKELICKGQYKQGSEESCLLKQIPCFLVLYALDSLGNA